MKISELIDKLNHAKSIGDVEVFIQNQKSDEPFDKKPQSIQIKIKEHILFDDDEINDDLVILIV